MKRLQRALVVVGLGLMLAGGTAASIGIGILLLIVLSYRTPRDEQPVHENDPR